MIGKSFRDERRWTFFNGLENGSTNIVLWLSMLWLAGGCCGWWWNAGTISSLCSYYYARQLTHGLDTENYEQLLCVNYWISLQRWAATVWMLSVVACLLCFCIFLFCWSVHFVFKRPTAHLLWTTILGILLVFALLHLGSFEFQTNTLICLFSFFLLRLNKTFKSHAFSFCWWISQVVYSLDNRHDKRSLILPRKSLFFFW